MENLYINLFASLIWLFIGILVVKIKNYASFIYPLKRLWNFKCPKNSIICIANSTITDTGNYYRPATGMGQVKAVATLIMSLKSAYNKMNIDHIYMSTDQLHQKIENDIIILGGVKNNSIAAHYLNLMAGIQPVQMSGNTFIWNENKMQKFSGKTNTKIVISDYGLIMRTFNPFSTNRKATTAIFIAGSHTYGTIAASRYFTETLIDNKGLTTKDNIVILISCDVVNGQVTNIIKIKEYSWDHENN